MGEYMVALVGEKSYQKAIAGCARGHVVNLVHEPDNPYDPRAVKAVTGGGQTIGYLSRDHWVGRAIIDDQIDHFAAIAEVTGGERGKPSQGIVLALFTAKDAATMRAKTFPRAGNDSPKTARPAAAPVAKTLGKFIGGLLFRK